MEAALLLPTLMVLIALLVQPAVLLYTRAVMQSAATEACRVLLTSKGDEVSIGAVRGFVERRLGAVPDAGIFHVGGSDGWTVTVEGPGDGHDVGVRIQGRARVLPLLGVLAAFAGEVGPDGCVNLEVAVRLDMRPVWLEGDYGQWSSTWG